MMIPWERYDPIIREMRGLGASVYVIAAKILISHQAVETRLHVLGLPMFRRRGVWTVERRAKLRELRACGKMSWAAIAKELGVSVKAADSQWRHEVHP